MNLGLFGPIGTTELLVVMGVIVLLFGATRLPKLARGIGSSFSEFKKGLREADNLKEEVGREMRGIRQSLADGVEERDE